MSISPPSSTPFTASALQQQPARSDQSGSQSGLKNHARETPEDVAQRAEKDARVRITRAEQETKNAEKKAAEQMEEIRDTYVAKSEENSSRLEEQAQMEQLKGYEDLRTLQRAQQAEIQRVKREGERDLRKATEYYRDTVYDTRDRNEKELMDLRNKNEMSRYFEQERHLNELDLLKETNAKVLETVKARQEEQTMSKSSTSQDEMERIKNNYTLALKQAEETYEKSYSDTVAEQNETLAKIQNKSKQALDQIRADTSRKLSAYQTRQQDPFYQMMDLSPSFDETSDSYRLTLSLPDHEHKNVSVSVRGNQIVISGSRRSQDKVESEPGHKISTANYQTFSETFPIRYPIDTRYVTRESEGDELTFLLPKKGSVMETGYQRKASINKAKFEVPDFPESLPKISTSTPQKEGDEAPPPSPKRPGSGTLT